MPIGAIGVPNIGEGDEPGRGGACAPSCPVPVPVAGAGAATAATVGCGVKCAGIFGESFQGMPPFCLAATGAGPDPDGRSDALISPAAALASGAEATTGSKGGAVRATSIAWGGLAAGASTGGGVASVDAAGAAG
ncbi:MAG TPA: hypothetical protein VH374_12820 [Polyangia bacterium]|nr:hypothetical protein [Polyangia bacterium]